MMAAEAQAYCTAYTKKSGSNFYYSFLFLPKAKRDAMYTVYAFCKAVDSAVDEPAAGSNPKDELKRWREELDAVYSGIPTIPIMVSLAYHVKILGIPKAYFEELIKGVEMDLFNNRYGTFDELSLYCYRVASVVGLICLHIFGVTSARAQDYAVALGMAFQLTNILRDVGTDAAERRIYLPLDDLQKWNYPEKSMLNRSYSAEFRALMEYEASRAHHYYKRADAALQGLSPQERRALTVAEIMRGIYSRILERIERSDYQVFGPRITLTTTQRVVIALGIWLRSRFS
ncbi:presqualene diphosphate synthase HpnD [Candidatus Nitrospira nitrificans]|uniref:Phytoene synthase n=1 Tax=Candidatus Nitrospira nitrificans TaxID=1742973 RepID=A0A0S4L8T3_9BACT|nr:presqualene diphosphate synthase HpnD [Candidatus Nitrospira nitrificans]CUS33040.1 Phytoene synthase [Candidatus Nitrospira nitrificans]